MDPLSALVDTLDVGGLVHCRVEATAPWGMSAEPDNLASFHAIRRGTAVLRVDGVPEPILLEAGDVVVVPHGSSHAIVDSLTTPAVRFADEVGARGLSATGVLVTGGGRLPATSILCGGFVGSGQRPPILSLLPRVLLLRAGGPTPIREHARARRQSIESSLATIELEMSAQQPGRGAIVTRLTTILFVQLLREWLEDRPHDCDALLGSMTDPAITRALALVEQAPASDWSVEELARRVGMSRSAFASRFAELVGEAPIKYITRIRLQRAAVLLRAQASGISEVARLVGYDSDAAFSRAFKRHFGAGPADYRRALPSALVPSAGDAAVQRIAPRIAASEG
jgi:AraC family transcriptional regulator, alkane utilization regulator